VNTPPNSAIGSALGRQIRAGTGPRTVPTRASGANAVLDILDEVRTRDVLTLNQHRDARSN